MVGLLARRERRPFWGCLSLLLLVTVGASMVMGVRARSAATEQAGRDAELVARTELAPMLVPRDLVTPIIGDRAVQLTTRIDDAITSVTPIGRVRIYSSLGRILYSADPKIVGTRPTYLKNLTLEVTAADARSVIHSGLLQTYVPIWLDPGGTVVVAEMSQAYGPIASEASQSWTMIALACTVLFLGAIAMVVVTTLHEPSPIPVHVYHQQASARQVKELRAATLDRPIHEHPGYPAIEEQRKAAEIRATAAEQNHREVQQQLHDARTQLKDLEGRLAMQETHPTTNDAELQTLRDQLKDTSERLHKAQNDNNKLRERMALRQRQLEDARHQMASIRADGSDMQELAQRLAAAESRAGQVAREMERLKGELDFTTSKLHMTKLSEALREFGGDDAQIEVSPDEDDLFDHPVIIRGTGARRTSPEKVR